MIGLRGDAGIGKSRLIADWTGALLSQGVDVCITQAWGYASTRAYSTAADLIASMVGLPAHWRDRSKTNGNAGLGREMARRRRRPSGSGE